MDNERPGMTTTTTLGELTADYILDPAGTRIGFVARQAIFTTVRGQFTEFAGSAHLDGDDPSKSSARLTIQAASIQTASARRDDHLRRAFLDTPDHPAITFTCDLTLRGTTKPVTVDFELTGAGYDQQGAFRAGFQGTVTINRRDWGVGWSAVLEGGGALVSNKVTLELAPVAVRQS